MDGTDRTYRPELNDSYNSEWAVCLFRSPLSVESRALSVAGLTCPLQWAAFLYNSSYLPQRTKRSARLLLLSADGTDPSYPGHPRLNSCLSTYVACAGMTS